MLPIFGSVFCSVWNMEPCIGYIMNCNIVANRRFHILFLSEPSIGYIVCTGLCALGCMEKFFLCAVSLMILNSRPREGSTDPHIIELSVLLYAILPAIFCLMLFLYL